MELQNFEHALAQAGKRHVKNQEQFAKLTQTFKAQLAEGAFPSMAVHNEEQDQFSVVFLGHEWLMRITTNASTGAGVMRAYVVKRFPDAAPEYSVVDRSPVRIDQSGNISVGERSGHTGDGYDVRAVVFHALGLHKMD